MARDYLSIPGMCSTSVQAVLLILALKLATSVDVERVFSRGRLILSHVRSGLSAHSIRALVCLGPWSCMGMVKDDDVKAVSMMPEVEGEVEVALGDDWDAIHA
jgi:hypothetical protein